MKTIALLLCGGERVIFVACLYAIECIPSYNGSRVAVMNLVPRDVRAIRLWCN